MRGERGERLEVDEFGKGMLCFRRKFRAKVFDLTRKQKAASLACLTVIPRFYPCLAFASNNQLTYVSITGEHRIETSN